MPKRVCNVAHCPALTDGSPRCATHTRDADQARGTAHHRGYGTTHRRTFREAVLTRDPRCCLCHAAPSTVADHHPLSRRDLVAQGANPNDPSHGRGLCHRCHSQATAQAQPGGWNQPPAAC